MRYHEIPKLTREEALQQLNGDDEFLKAEALISLAWFDPDCRWVQSLCLDLAYSQELNLRETAILCLGYLARLRNQIDLDVVVPVLYDLHGNPDLAEQVKVALLDIEGTEGFDRKEEDRRRGVNTDY